ncbi:hypothetical protein BVC93_20245 [Mycobacterium sp. MS1601]|uniref:hypothetical protein n=1 Tax=Mycobacterium sp. MS1601 TaxID=1936029 RepID=UPI000979226C|nr:hypothetical protein [Mycobacterium sp. MS1601]AQA04368.1 hypothetical protein BVC93_20245 [Mycobacterium sp. MS1601]
MSDADAVYQLLKENVHECSYPDCDQHPTNRMLVQENGKHMGVGACDEHWEAVEREVVQRDWSDRANTLVAQEIEDVLTTTVADAPRSDAYNAAFLRAVEHPGQVVIEVAALAGEAIIRLAKERDEDPRATLAWIRSTDWTKA